MELPADPISIPMARAQVRRWLAEFSWPAVKLDDIVLAVSEAVSNAVEHAYLGPTERGGRGPRWNRGNTGRAAPGHGHRARPGALAPSTDRRREPPPRDPAHAGVLDTVTTRSA
jgi:hypothetical protein